jgi:hypothetical protein
MASKTVSSSVEIVSPCKEEEAATAARASDREPKLMGGATAIGAFSPDQKEGDLARKQFMEC